MSKAKEVSPKDIPEVAAFIGADQRLKEFKEEYADIFVQLDEIISDRNDKLEAAEKIVRAHKVTCGPFVLFQYQTKYNAQAFYDAVGRDDFLKLGGTIQTVPKYEIDKKAFEAMVSQKKIPQTVIEAVVETSPRYKCPDKLTV